MYPYIEILRPGKSLMSVAFVMIGVIVSLGNARLVLLGDISFSYGTLLALVAFFMINGAGNTINDFFDVESNRMDKPRRPIPSGRVSDRGAFFYSVALFTAGILISAMLNYVCFIIAVINSVVLILYSKAFQGGILSSVSAGYLTGSAFLFGAAASGDMSTAFWLFLIMALSTMSRKLVKLMEDMEGDRRTILKGMKSGMKRKVTDGLRITRKRIDSRGMVWGKGILAVAFLVMAIASTPLPYALSLDGPVYLALVMIADAFFVLSLYMILVRRGRKQLRKAGSMIKKGRWMVVIAFLLSALLFA